MTYTVSFPKAERDRIERAAKILHWDDPKEMVRYIVYHITERNFRWEEERKRKRKQAKAA